MFALSFQFLFTLWFFILHFIPIFPLNDINIFPNSFRWNLFLGLHWLLLIGLIVAQIYHLPYSNFLATIYLGLLFLGHINTWWLPYFFGWPKVFVEEEKVDYGITLRFFPPHKNHPVPDLGYTIFGILCFLAFILTILKL